MKRSILGLICIVAFGVMQQASAIPIEIPINGDDVAPVGSANNPSDNLNLLKSAIAAYDAIPGALAPLPVPTLTGEAEGNKNKPTDVAGFDYAVVRFTGTRSAKAYEIWYLDGATSFTFPADAGPTLTSDTIDTIRLFNGTPVPDGGTTLGLLGAALTGLSLIRRKMK